MEQSPEINSHVHDHDFSQGCKDYSIRTIFSTNGAGKAAYSCAKE
jgi:hypothetical protein